MNQDQIDESFIAVNGQRKRSYKDLEKRVSALEDQIFSEMSRNFKLFTSI